MKTNDSWADRTSAKTAAAVVPGVNVGPNVGFLRLTVAKAHAKAPPGMTATAINSPRLGRRTLARRTST